MSTAGSGRPDVVDALHATRELHAETEALLDAVAVRYGLYRTDLRCLEILQREGEMRARRLAGLSKLSPAAVTKIVDRLVAAGYATRRPSTDDRRAQVIAVSERNMELRTGIWEPVRQDAMTVLDTASPDELRRIVEIVRGLAEVNRAHAHRIGDAG